MELPRRRLWPERPAAEFTIGLDLGQSRDYTALSAIERIRHESPSGIHVTYELRALERWPLGTRYPKIVADVAALLARAPLAPAESTLVVDRTGVGAAVCDLFVEAGLDPVQVTLTAGMAVSRAGRQVHLPKREAVHTALALLQTGRLTLAASLPLLETLVHELTNFAIKVDLRTGADRYESWRESVHDDLVLSLALACWVAQFWDPTETDEATAQSLQDYLGDAWQPWAQALPEEARRWGRINGHRGAYRERRRLPRA
jgi:hypothetical protein